MKIWYNRGFVLLKKYYHEEVFYITHVQIVSMVHWIRPIKKLYVVTTRGLINHFMWYIYYAGLCVLYEINYEILKIITLRILVLMYQLLSSICIRIAAKYKIKIEFIYASLN